MSPYTSSCGPEKTATVPRVTHSVTKPHLAKERELPPTVCLSLGKQTIPSEKTHSGLPFTVSNAHFLSAREGRKERCGTSALCSGRWRSYGRGSNGFWTGRQEYLLPCKEFWLPRIFLPLLFVFSFSVTESCSRFGDTISHFWPTFNIIKHNILKFSSVPCFTSIFLEFPLYVFLLLFCFVLCSLSLSC